MALVYCLDSKCCKILNKVELLFSRKPITLNDLYDVSDNYLIWPNWPSSRYCNEVTVHWEIDFKLADTHDENTYIFLNDKYTSHGAFQFSETLILMEFMLTFLTIHTVFIWSYLCIRRLISNLITRESKMFSWKTHFVLNSLL